MTAKLSNNTKIFILNRSDLEGRIEPEFYKPFNINLYKRIVEKKHFRLKDIVSFSNETWNQKDLFTETFPYIEISEIELETGEIKNIKNVKMEEAPSRAKMLLRKNDIIISTTRPTRGAIALYRNDEIAIASTGFSVIRKVNEDIFLKEALFTVLRLPFVLQQMGQRSSGGNYPAITQEELGKVVIPFLEKEKQQEIILIYKTAYTQKQQKEAQAKALLQSIDTYILETLSITIPQKQSGIEHRMFTANFSDVVGGRLDGYFYQKEFIDFFSSLQHSKYPVLTLKQISKKITSGITPLSGGDAYTSPEEGIPFVRSGNININGDLNFDDLLYLKPEIHNTIMKSSQLQYNDIMIAIVGATIGQIGIYLDKREANINQAIALIRLKDNNLFNPTYIKEVIKSSIGQQSLNRLKRPVARANINLEEISTMQIIVPPIDIQLKIVKQVEEIRNQAKKLKADAIAVLDNAKAAVEKIIIG